jgi:hypothetical protein
MSPILTRCRDAEMLGPVCDVISNDKPLSDTIREIRTSAAVHNEPEITDEDVTELEELLIEGDECCCRDTECCC